MKVRIIEKEITKKEDLLISWELLESIGIIPDDNLKIIVAEDCIMLMSSATYGLKMLKK